MEKKLQKFCVAMRDADNLFEAQKATGTKTYILDYLLPEMKKNGLVIVEENIQPEPAMPKIAEIENIINDLEYSAYNLCDGKKHTDLPKGIVESTGAKDTLLIAIRDLKNWISSFTQLNKGE